MHCAACSSRLIVVAAVTSRSGQPPLAPPSPPIVNRQWHHTLALRCVAGVLSLGVFNNANSLGLAHEFAATYDHQRKRQIEVQWVVAEKCEEQALAEPAPELATSTVSNEKIVDEAWTIVNDSFMNYGRSKWDPERWRVIGFSLMIGFRNVLGSPCIISRVKVLPEVHLLDRMDRFSGSQV